MFKFNFGQNLDNSLDLEEDMATEGADEIILTPREEQQHKETRQQDACEEISLEDLIKTLSPIISYTPLIIQSGKEDMNVAADGTLSIILPRRDLYDARFQIIAEGVLSDEEDENEDRMDVEDAPERDPLPPPPVILDLRQTHPADLEYIDAPSDVIPNVYEGGLKTWECSIDVVEYLSQLDRMPFSGKAILEVGCGTAMPTSYLLQSLFNTNGANVTSSPSSSDKRTVIHLQDYNRSVLELVTLPNLILTWHSSKAAEPYRALRSPSTPLDPTAPGELPIDSQLVDAFLGSLKTHGIQLKFSAGSWSSFEPRRAGDRPFDLVITSETIYRSANVISLLAVLRSASITAPKTGFFSTLPVMNRRQEVAPIVLVAAKVLYFGVGGSVDEFTSMAKHAGATVTTVVDIAVGVGRRILKLDFTS